MALVGLFLFWTLNIISSKWEQIVNPLNQTGVDVKWESELEYPAITICNIALDVELSHLDCAPS